MSRVICDVCGTTYPETAAQCPICASAKNSASQTAAGGESIASGYAHTKGGHFSKKNVRKRSKGVTPRKGSGGSTKRDEPNNTGLVVVVVLLMIAIVMVLIYIGVRYFQNREGIEDPPKQSTGQTEEQTQPTQTDPSEAVIPCEGIQLSNIIVELLSEGETWQLTVEKTPVDTTEAVTFTSSDESIVTVSEDGTITAVSGGKANITVTCGNAAATCVVSCKFGDYVSGDVPVEELVFEWNTSYIDKNTGNGDTTLISEGAAWRAYKSSLNVDAKDIIWTSDDESICTVANGVVTAVAPGITKIHAQYGSKTFTCVIRCSFKASSSGSNTGTDDNFGTSGNCTISHKDVTIAVGESFTLRLKDSTGNTLDVTWTASNGNVTISGNKITGVESGSVTVSVTYEGVTYSCVVRVK